jgi:hypothetical protein
VFLSWFIAKLLQIWSSLVFLISNISSVWHSSPVVTAELISEILHLSRKPKLINLIARYFSDFLQLSQSGTRMFPSLPATCQPEFGLLPHSFEISSVICCCSGSKNFISLDIRYWSWLIRYRGTPNFLSPVFISNTDFRNFIFVIFLFFLRQTSLPCCSSLVLAPSLTSVPALIPQY